MPAHARCQPQGPGIVQAAAPAQIVSASPDDWSMGKGVGTAVEMAGVHASVAALDALFLRDAQLRNPDGAGAGVDVLQHAYELRLERMLLASKLEGQVAALKARDAAESVELQQSMTPPDAPVQEHSFQKISTVEEIAGVLTISSGAAGRSLPRPDGSAPSLPCTGRCPPGRCPGSRPKSSPTKRTI